MLFYSLDELSKQFDLPFIAENFYRKERYLILEKTKEGSFSGKVLEDNFTVPRFSEASATLSPISSCWILPWEKRKCYAKKDNIYYVFF